MVHKRIVKVALLASLSAALVSGIFYSGLLTGFEHRAYDLFSRRLNPDRSDGQIVIVQIDQRSIDAVSGQGITWPWPRQMYAPLVEYLSMADAVIFDIVYSEPSSYGDDDDRTFAEAINKAGNVYLPFVLSKGDRRLTSEGRSFLMKHSIRKAISGLPQFASATVPISPLRDHVKGTGNVAIEPDGDGVYRDIPLFARMGDTLLPNLATACIADRAGNDMYDTIIRLPLKEGKLLLRFYRGDGAFPKLSAVDVINAYIGSSSDPLISREYFKGKKVFIGLTAAGLYDLKPTSVSALSTGVTVHATALDNMLRGSYLKPVNSGLLIVLMIIVCVTTTYFVLRYHTLIRNALLLMCGLLLTVGLPAALFRASHYLEIIPLPLSLLSSFIVASAYSYATEGRERRFIRKTFSQYMDEKIVSHVLENPELIRPGGVRKRVTVFFADIAGFTTISELLSAEETALILHTVLNAFTEVIIRNSGTIDKYIGDCVMAFWGAPLGTEDDAANACRAAIDCMDELEKINIRFRERGLSPISMRIGIHTGDAIVGNLGSDRLFDYTAVGDTVNTASRLESVNKVFKTRIIVSEETLNETGGGFFARDLGMIEVKGKNVPLRIFELIGESGKLPDDRKSAAELYRDAMDHFNKREFDACAALLQDLLQKFPDDGPSQFYLRRARDSGMKTLTESWNVIKMTEK